MPQFTKNCLSGSTNGKAIKIVQTATPGTAVHTATSSSSSWDEVWIYAVNTYSSSVTLTLEWGSYTAPDNNIPIVIPAYSGILLVAPGFILQNSLAITAFASVANVIMVYGYINNIA